jgi:methylmalonyl-CoA/ethylmalonyl-CoA epimerase
MAVRRPELTQACLRTLGYEIGDAVYDSGQRTYVQMCSSSVFPDIELVYGGDDDGPVARFTDAQDEAIYHICFRTESIDATVQGWRDSGIRVLRVKAKMPAPLFDDQPVGFYHVQGMGLVELLEAPGSEDGE